MISPCKWAIILYFNTSKLHNVQVAFTIAKIRSHCCTWKKSRFNMKAASTSCTRLIEIQKTNIQILINKAKKRRFAMLTHKKKHFSTLRIPLARGRCSHGELILLDRLLDPVAAAGVEQRLVQLLLGALVLGGQLLHLGVARRGADDRRRHQVVAHLQESGEDCKRISPKITILHRELRKRR